MDSSSTHSGKSDLTRFVPALAHLLNLIVLCSARSDPTVAISKISNGSPFLEKQIAVYFLCFIIQVDSWMYAIKVIVLWMFTILDSNICRIWILILFDPYFVTSVQPDDPQIPSSPFTYLVKLLFYFFQPKFSNLSSVVEGNRRTYEHT